MSICCLNLNIILRFDELCFSESWDQQFQSEHQEMGVAKENGTDLYDAVVMSPSA